MMMKFLGSQPKEMSSWNESISQSRLQTLTTLFITKQDRI